MYIKIIRPSSLGHSDILQANISDLEKRGIKVLYEEKSPDPNNHSSYTVQDRLEELVEALTNPDYDYVMCARGGYGASDLLDFIPWDRLKNVPPKTLVGFSDICALHSALYSKLSWCGLHAPMPASKLWAANKKMLTRYLSFLTEGARSFSLPLNLKLSSASLKTSSSIEGKLFGGCLTVITALIGTPYFPNLKDHILFLEDIRENPGTVNTMINQWIQSGSLEGVKAVVLGNFVRYGSSQDYAQLVKKIEEKTRISCFSSRYFGHISLNYPLLIGASAVIKGSSLKWHKQKLGGKYV